MSSFINLTCVDSKDSPPYLRGVIVTIGIEGLKRGYFFRSFSNKSTCVHIDGMNFDVIETPETILHLIGCDTNCKG